MSSTPHTPYRPPQVRMTVRPREPTLHDRDSVYHLPHGPDWFWLGLFTIVILGSGAYVWQQTGLDSEAGRAVFFAGVLLSILWAALIYTLKLSASVAVGPRGLSLVRGPWRTELTWAEVARLAERGKTTGGQHYRWLVAFAHDARELRIREDMVPDYGRFRLDVYERYKLWQDHGGTWGATGGGPFAAEEEVTTLVTWWLIASGACLLPGLYFAVLLPETFVLGIILVALATVSALLALWISLGRQTYTVDRRAVVACQTIGTRALAWSEVTQVKRIRSRVRLLARVGILIGRAALALAARADSRVESFTWTPRIPEYLVLRAVGGRQIRMRLHRIARPDELLAWVEFYDRVARQGQERPRSSAQPLGTPPPAPGLPDLGGAGGPLDPWAGTRDGAPGQGAGRRAPTLLPTVQPVQPGPASPAHVAGPASPVNPPPSGPRVTRPILGGSEADSIDPRILAVLQDVAGIERGRPSGSPDAQRGSGAESDWLNETMYQSPIPRPGARISDEQAGRGRE
jgi:hypothetical protein